MTLRIVAEVNEDGTTIRLIGHMQAEHIAHVRAEMAASRVPTVLDLDEVTLADVEAVPFLVPAPREGMVPPRCAPFLPRWVRPGTHPLLRRRDTSNSHYGGTLLRP